MSAESATSEQKASANLAIWLSGAFGLAIVLGAAFITGFLVWPFGGNGAAVAKPKEKPPVSIDRGAQITPPVTQRNSVYDADAGEIAIAKLWSGIDTAKLAAITNEWRPIELAPVLMRMKGDKVSELLSEMKPDRASAVSREIQRLSSL
jgi:hypothetical protein